MVALEWPIDDRHFSFCSRAQSWKLDEGALEKTWWGCRIWGKATVKNEVLSYLMSQPYSNDKEFCIVRCVICTLQCTTQSADSPSQLLMCRRVKTAKAERGSWVECLRLRVFKSLSTSHATAMCMLQYTCRAWEYWGERTRGMASRHGGGAHRRRDRLSNRKSFPAAGAKKNKTLGQLMTLSTHISRREFYIVRWGIIFISSLPKLKIREWTL